MFNNSFPIFAVDNRVDKLTHFAVCGHHLFDFAIDDVKEFHWGIVVPREKNTYEAQQVYWLPATGLPTHPPVWYVHTGVVK